MMATLTSSKARRSPGMALHLVVTLFLLAAAPAFLAATGLGDDQLRPQFHVMPERYWMNDPNGPVFFNGLHHLFYQHNPDSIAWTNMHWGHAVSNELVFWAHLPVALSPGPEPYDSGGIWSGSVSIDPITRTPTIFYTGVSPQVQCVAYPADMSDPLLTHWNKSTSNPFLHSPPATFPQDNFRDPTTAWKSTDGYWYLLIGSGNEKGGAALLYRSRSGRFVDDAEYAGHPMARAQDINIDGSMWECPDFYPLSSGINETKWVLKASSQALGHGDHYYTGAYDQKNQTFSADVHGIYDYGSKFYASKSFLDNNPILSVPRQSLPRTLSLDTDGTLLIAPIPELAALRLPDDHLHVDGLKIKAGTSFSLGSIEIVQAEILIHFSYAYVFFGPQFPAGSTFGVRLLQSPDKREQTEIALQGVLPMTKGLDLPGGDYRSLQVQINDYASCEAACNQDPLCHAWTLITGTPGRDNCWLKASIPASKPNPQTVSGAKGLLRANRTLSSLYPKADSFPEFGPLLPPTGPDGWAMRNLTLHIFVDHSIVEVFVNQGKERLTSRVYPTLPDSRFAELFVDGPHDVFVTSIDVWQLRTVWL
ncbi:glycosyl hydrolases family 32 superfamily protein [Acanthamoeba castellanii str. Neff]|uniref:Glycosyl hydrolases family 32 superfamily protein n=1 Tax=Acanthamoeba castellanii (strain ATCC 30010 / Neff) TaxID=1257118 RepID=L8GRF2_ACACF|nr:glycosyl hydrolases family 32 superfamily protein [Acanthamoeba castellanii str. Neff]ELR15550.1 glycosyl hydrolases family 32 superfamily protein [Acanthamoeba castellanii str. Neff]